MTEEGRFEPCWAIVELFGHSKIAGEISEQTIAGGSFLRVDVPAVDGEGAFTRFYGASAVYSITPVAEQVARAATGQFAVRPVTIWMPAAKQLPLPEYDEESDDRDDDEIPY